MATVFAGFSTEETSSVEKLNVVDLIEDTLLFTDFQLRQQGIIISKEYDEKSLIISGNKMQLEHALLSILLIIKESLFEGGVLHIGVYKARAGKRSNHNIL